MVACRTNGLFSQPRPPVVSTLLSLTLGLILCGCCHTDTCRLTSRAEALPTGKLKKAKDLLTDKAASEVVKSVCGPRVLGRLVPRVKQEAGQIMESLLLLPDECGDDELATETKDGKGTTITHLVGEALSAAQELEARCQQKLPKKSQAGSSPSSPKPGASTPSEAHVDWRTELDEVTNTLRGTTPEKAGDQPTAEAPNPPSESKPKTPIPETPGTSAEPKPGTPTEPKPGTPTEPKPDAPAEVPAGKPSKAPGPPSLPRLPQSPAEGSNLPNWQPPEGQSAPPADSKPTSDKRNNEVQSNGTPSATTDVEKVNQPGTDETSEDKPSAAEKDPVGEALKKYDRICGQGHITEVMENGLPGDLAELHRRCAALQTLAMERRQQSCLDTVNAALAKVCQGNKECEARQRAACDSVVIPVGTRGIWTARILGEADAAPEMSLGAGLSLEWRSPATFVALTGRTRPSQTKAKSNRSEVGAFLLYPSESGLGGMDAAVTFFVTDDRMRRAMKKGFRLGFGLSLDAGFADVAIDGDNVSMSALGYGLHMTMAYSNEIGLDEEYGAPRFIPALKDRVEVVFRLGYEGRHLLGDASFVEFESARVGLMSTDSTAWQGFSLGLAFTYGSTVLALDVPFLWAVDGEVQGPAFGVTDGQVGVRLTASIGFGLSD
jgi:hypothetical protein